jgi:hypothetical protein
MILLLFAVATMALASPLSAHVGHRLPVVDGTVRDGLQSPKDGVADAVLDGSVVQVLDVERASQPFEDRGIVEFDVSGFAGSKAKIDLVLTTFDSMGPFPFTVDVLVYAADGSLTPSDFSAGIPVASFEYSGEAHVTIDVTDAIQGRIASGNEIAGFNLRMAAPTTIESNGPFVAFGSLDYPPAAVLRTHGGHRRHPHPHP